ncbi:MAG: carbohydrate ABC transporter permease [Enterococcus casseliflavus]
MESSKRIVSTKTVGKKRINDQRWSYPFLLPAVIAVCAIVIVPFVIGIYYSFTKWDGISVSTFVGLDNFKRILSDKEFMNSLWFTLKFSVVTVALINLVGLGLALIVTKGFRGSSILRTVFFMPNLIGGLILGFIWQFVFVKAFSAIGTAVGVEVLNGWLSTPTTGFWGMVLMVVWQYAGYIMVIYVAFLQGVDESLLEAASLDGASEWQQMLQIKLPMIRPAFTISLFMSLSFCFKIYDQNLALTSGGPFKSTTMVAMNIVNTAFSQREMGLAQAKGMIFFLILTIISVTQVFLSSRKEVEV